ncbi:MAG: hypothetical protein QNJ11_20320 [Woeseiaceae bacterium]|nr:hypothetical protein [Woeseiaceae bacterium]
MKRIAIVMLLALFGASVAAQETVEETEQKTEQDDEAAVETSAEQPQGDGISSPKTLSGMSILGNEEAPKALVIVPWKSSELGDDINLTDTLDERARPVDKEVFLRELRFYEIRAGEQK